MPWGAIAAGAASLLGGAMGADASRDAGRAQGRASQRQLDFQRWLYEQQVGRQQPWYGSGGAALNELNAFFGYPQQAIPGGPSGGGYGFGGTSGTVGRSGLGDPLGLPDPLGIFGNSGRTATWGGQNQLTAKNVLKMLKQGRTLEEISKLGILETSLNPKRTNKLFKAGLDADEIRTLQQGYQEPTAAAAEYKGPTGMDLVSQSPEFQLGRDESSKDVLGLFGASGQGAFSGNALRELDKVTGSELDRWLGRRFQMAGFGPQAANSQQSAGNAFGYGGSNALMNMGDARASGIAGAANMWGQGIGGAANAFGNWWGNRNSGIPQNNTPGYIPPGRPGYFNPEWTP